jgi:hypothetical protein
MLMGTAAAPSGNRGGAPAAASDSDADADAGRGDATGAAPRAAPRREGDMVVTFGVGLGERMAAKRAAASEAPETVWQAHLRERKEKKRAGKAATAEAGEDAGAADLGFNDPFFAAGDGDGGGARPNKERKQRNDKKQQGDAAPGSASAAAAAEEARRTAELELLLLDDARLKAGAAPLRRAGRGGGAAVAEDDGEPAAPASRKEARAAVKAAKRARRMARITGSADDGVALDTRDARFSALFTRPEYALDPTDARFKAVRSVDTIRRETAARRAASHTALDGAHAALAAEVAAPEEEAAFGSVVARLKRKAGARM